MVCCRIAFSEACFSWLVFVQSSFNSSLQEPCKYFVTVAFTGWYFVSLSCLFVCLREGEWGEGRAARRVGGGGKALFWQLKDNFQAPTWASIGW